MSVRSEYLKESGWVQVSPRMWKAPWQTAPVDILKAEKIQHQLDAGGEVLVCGSCKWPVAKIVRTTPTKQRYVECLGCTERRITAGCERQ